jgi:hypothetical protein
MNKLRPFSATLLTLCGIILVGMGIYFALVRPALLPEDSRYIGLSVSDIQAALPGLADWLRRVFTVMGAYILTVGFLIVYIARTSFRTRAKGAGWIAAVAGLTSIGWMTVVNFAINSDFKWLLFSFAALWIIALALFRREK